eukprot:Nitzschia sp. Nitz4//scaffold159_size51929//20171//21115//NITZ4_006876-RA/size51929-processed-gene-0.43-mRNA-1//1//CDS//3329537565//4427//frame0
MGYTRVAHCAPSTTSAGKKLPTSSTEDGLLRRTRTYQSLVDLIAPFTAKIRNGAVEDEIFSLGELIENSDQRGFQHCNTATEPFLAVLPRNGGGGGERSWATSGYPPHQKFNSDTHVRPDESNSNFEVPREGSQFVPDSLDRSRRGFYRGPRASHDSRVRRTDESSTTTSNTSCDGHKKHLAPTFSRSDTRALNIMSAATPTSLSISPQGSRRRSCAIAIKRHPNNATGYYSSQQDIIATQEAENNERLYNSATRRMFDRIVDHRLSQGLPLSVAQMIGQDQITYPQDNTATATTTTDSSNDDMLDGEIFELEM